VAKIKADLILDKFVFASAHMVKPAPWSFWKVAYFAAGVAGVSAGLAVVVAAAVFLCFFTCVLAGAVVLALSFAGACAAGAGAWANERPATASVNERPRTAEMSFFMMFNPISFSRLFAYRL
jgi:hypothetical protein